MKKKVTSSVGQAESTLTESDARGGTILTQAEIADMLGGDFSHLSQDQHTTNGSTTNETM